MRDLMRELQRSVQLSDLFVSILGHDLRTPLGAIKLSAEAIVRHPETSALRAAGRILGSTDRMTRMIEQLLDFARVRRGRGIPVKPRAANLGEVCRAVVEELGYAHPQARILVEEKGSLAGEWDPDRLAQVVSNLVANAVQHGAGGAPVEVELDGRDQELVRVRVHNLGSMPAAIMPTLFEAFADSPTPGARPARSGLGLGLFIAREITRAHGGDIAVRSAEPEGTTFEVVLPRRSLGKEVPATASPAVDSTPGAEATH
jgi:signal transduction histidine kinase